MSDKIKELKKLSPKERIKKLKEVQEKDKKEIEEAQELLKQAEEEADIEEELKEVPIPQLKAVNINELFSPEEKELFKTKRFVSGKKEDSEQKDEEDTDIDNEKSGLESIAQTAPRLSEEEKQQHTNYLQQLSKAPANELYSEAKELYQEFKEKGYLNSEEQERFNNIGYANKKKFKAAESGDYPGISKEVAQEMLLIEKMKKGLYR